MADREMGDSVAVQDSAGCQAAASCGTLFCLQPGRSSPTLVSKPSCANLSQAVGAVAGKQQEKKPVQEAPPPPFGKKTARTATGRVLANHLQLTDPAFSPPPQEGALRLPPPSFQAQSSATSSSWSGALPVSRILHRVAQRVAHPQGKSKTAAVAPHGFLPPTQLETIRVQGQPEQTKENERPASSFTTVQCRNETSSQSAEKNTGGLELNAINPQIIRIQPITGSGSQQFLLYNSSEPTIQLLLQRPLHPLGQVTLDKTTTPRILNGQKASSVTIAADNSPNATPVSTCSANSITNQKKQKKQKLKKSLKVKTRSGRISRPPKYKAKDYKFIKTEDLADCHQSDSDDYSELSVEDDDEGKGVEVPSLFGSLNYDLRPKMFKCQTCEKSYIGKGGLARHYKLNPDHGRQESSHSSSINRSHRMTLLEDIGKISGESAYQNSSPPPTVINENELAIDIGKNLHSESEQQSGTCVEDRIFEEQQNAHLLHMGSRTPRRPRRCGRSKMAERSRYSGRFNRPSQFPSKSLNNMSAEHQSVFRRKARLKELIQQCENEDFMELAVPRFTTLVTAFEFLLMKVGKNCATKAAFPDVYKEFEELHAMVKKMCQDYFSDPEISKVVEIKNHKVAESLGITDSLLRLQKIQADFSPEHIKSTHEYMLTEILGQKRPAKGSDEILPFAKKTRRESLLENANINYSRPSEVKERNSISEENCCVGNSFSGNRVLEKEQHELEAVNEYINPDLIYQPMKAESVHSQPSRTPGSNYLSDLSSWGEIMPSVNAEISQEEVVQINSNWNATNGQYESEVCNTVASEVAGLNPDLSLLEENDNEKYDDLEEAAEDSTAVTCTGFPQGSDPSENTFSKNTILEAHPFGSESCFYSSNCSENS